MIPTWNIWLDGCPYGGEYQTQNGTKLLFGSKEFPIEPVEIQGKTNLRSHIDRIFNRLGGELDPKQIIVQRCQ